MLNEKDWFTNRYHRDSAGVSHNRGRGFGMACRARRSLRAVLSMWLALCLAVCGVPCPAQAETSQEVRDQIAQDQVQLDQMTADLQQKQAEIDQLQSQIDDLAQQSMDLQNQIISDREVLRRIVVADYKDGGLSVLSILMSSQDIDDVIARMYYAQKVSEWQVKVVNQLKSDKAKLAAQMDQISSVKEEQQQQRDQLEQQTADMQTTIDSLNERAAELEEQERQAAEEAARKAAEAAAAAQAAQSAAATASPTQGSTDGWYTVTASAYSIADNDPPGSTATASGIPLDDSVPTVALPMSQNPYVHFGQLIEISYNGMSVVARVTDVGDMGGGTRGLDLSTAVYRAFGFSTPQSWGLRTVSYRYL